MTSKPPDGGSDPGRGSLGPFGRNRTEAVGGVNPAPGPVFDSPPPQHPLLVDLHILWIEADADSIGAILRAARSKVAEAPEEIRPWAVQYLQALEDLAGWLRDR